MKVEFNEREKELIDSFKNESSSEIFVSPEKGKECSLIVEVVDPAVFEVFLLKMLAPNREIKEDEQFGFRFKSVEYHGSVNEESTQLIDDIQKLVDQYKDKISRRNK